LARFYASPLSPQRPPRPQRDAFLAFTLGVQYDTRVTVGGRLAALQLRKRAIWNKFSALRGKCG